MSVTQQAIFWEIRLPRVVLGVLVGAMLAAAGTAYQGVFRNPLADPYLLGRLQRRRARRHARHRGRRGDRARSGIPLLAFVGGLLGVAATYALGSSVGGGRGRRRDRAGRGRGRRVLQRDPELRPAAVRRLAALGLLAGCWAGSAPTAGPTWSSRCPYVVVSCGVILLHRRVLDVMAVGDVEAASLGVDPARVRLVLVLTATLGTAAVVSVSGLIGFVGIVVPHAVRLLFGAAHHTLLPLALLLRRGVPGARRRRRPHRAGAGRGADRRRDRAGRRAVLPGRAAPAQGV